MTLADVVIRSSEALPSAVEEAGRSQGALKYRILGLPGRSYHDGVSILAEKKLESLAEVEVAMKSVVAVRDNVVDLSSSKIILPPRVMIDSDCKFTLELCN